jgi:hypothetical protein
VEKDPGCPAPVVWVQPVETGITAYEADDGISLGLVVDTGSGPALERVLTRFNDTVPTAGHGHFQPGVTVRLETVVSCLSGRGWRAADRPLVETDLAAEIDRLVHLF